MTRYLRLSLAEFQERTPDFLKQIKETGETIVLTVDGKAEAVMLDITSYRKLRPCRGSGDAGGNPAGTGRHEGGADHPPG